jgi:hypothetical protein
MKYTDDAPSRLVGLCMYISHHGDIGPELIDRIHSYLNVLIMISFTIIL